ncbi:DOMON-like domain-containing protein [Novosphingobium naphthalenivorans]|uniref:DOMON-like domain-containing protein n=1 Tax=Novosphingobium naphthalenivorans TaxID=273168 RepID=UPI0008296F51|nr:DOMON-like domain-containing protein [Novosphingobium naphthalenivorans]
MAELIRHPAHPPALVRSVEFRIIGFDANWLRARWKILGCGKLVVPPFAGKGRADGLWQTTCFELFLQQPGSPAYTEINLSPSERWNVYDFSAKREGMAERPMPHEPECTMRLGTDMAIFDAAIPAAGLPAPPWRYGATAVIAEEGGINSYWALSHASEAPDFHDPSCFLEEVAAPSAA